jgi:uncharacterized protein (DUF2267 family)
MPTRSIDLCIYCHGYGLSFCSVDVNDSTTAWGQLFHGEESMQRDEFIQRVERYGGLESSEEADQATEAVLSTLGERLYRTEQSHLAAELPNGIREFLVAQKPLETTRGDVEQFDLEAFYNRVGARANVRHAHAIRLTQAVMRVLQEAVSSGAIEDIKRELRDYDQLFQTSP